jgi:hypothetical protein
VKGEGAWVAAGAALCGFALAYALPAYAHLPTLLYDPRARTFSIGAFPGGVIIGFYGQLAWGAAGALVGLGGGAALGAGRGGRRAGLFAAWGLSALVIVGGWFAWNNWP